MRILVSRTDGIGDVLLTLPLLGVIKKHIPDATIIFLNSAYTSPVLENCEHVDELVSWNEVERKPISAQVAFLQGLRADTIIHVFPRPEIARAAKVAGIPNRIGTTGRLYHIHTCNQLVRFSRKRSPLHEAQLNLKLLKPMRIKTDYSTSELAAFYGFSAPPEIPQAIADKMIPGKKHIAMHPLSKGSAVEWGVENYRRLTELLPASEYQVFLTGTEAEGALFRGALPIDEKHIVDVSGKLSLKELIGFIDRCSGLIACSTGPLHIAAALGKCAIGLYTAKRPMHPGRWAPLGKKAHFLVQEVSTISPQTLFERPSIQRIAPERVKAELLAC